MSNQLKAAIIEPVGGHSGMDYYDFGLCDGLVKAGVEATLYTCDETKIPPHASFKIKTFYKNIYGSDPAWQRGLRFLKGSWRALVDAKRSGIQICHFHFFHIGPLELFNVTLAKLMGIIVVATVHDIEAFVDKLTVPTLAKLVYKFVDQVIVHNRFSQEEVIRVWKVPVGKTSVIVQGNQFHAIDTKKEQSEAKEHLDIPTDRKILLFFGQIKSVKGLDILLKSMPEIIEKHPDVLLVIAGRVWKDDFEKYDEIIRQYGLEEFCICHIRFIPNDQVHYYFSAADLVILPYRNIYQSAVILMALSYKVPVLVSDLPAMAELIADGENGFLFKSEDSRALASKVVHILEHPHLLKSIGESGFELMANQYSWAEVGKQTAQKYQSLLKT